MKILILLFFSLSNFIFNSEYLRNFSLILLNKEDSIDLDSIDSDIIRSTNKINSVIFEFNNHNSSLENHMKIKFYYNFYEISACFPKKMTIKNIKHIFESSLFTKSDVNHELLHNGEHRDEICYYRYDYLDTSSNRYLSHSKYFVIQKLQQNIEDQHMYSYLNEIFDYFDFDINLILEEINISLSKIGDFHLKNKFIEINLYFDSSSSKFLMNSMYYSVYCTSISSVDKIIQSLKSDYIKTFLIYYKKSNNLINITNTTSIEFERKKLILTNINYSISTLKSTHLFHNLLNINITISNKNELKDRYTCFFVNQPINEDIYVEQHEIFKYLEKKPKIVYHFSSFIDQELSCDFSPQYEFYFTFCEKTKLLLKFSKYELTYPFHFRYQPPLLNHYYRNISLPQPKITLVPYKIIKDRTFEINKYINLELMDPKRKETLLSKLEDLNHFDIYLNNKDSLLHQIPVGNSRYTILICLFTCMISFVGFFMIFIMIVLKPVSKVKLN